MSLAASANGATLLAGQWGGPLYFSTNYGATWMSYTAPVPHPEQIVWHGVAASADGKTLVAVDYGVGAGVFISTNSGTTWWQVTIPETFQAVVCSADGQTIVSVAQRPPPYADTSGIRLSKDGGGNWTQVNAPGKLWMSVACSADARIIAVTAQDLVFISTNSGALWTGISLPPAIYASIACSADGTKMVAGSDLGLIISTNSGTTWTGSAITNLEIFSVTCSADGTRITAAAYGGPIFLSANTGMTWTSANAASTNWYSLAASADGNLLLATARNASLKGFVYLRQSAPNPRLSIATRGENLNLAWTVPSSRFVLQENSDPSTPNWLDVSATPVLDCTNLQQQVTVPATLSSRFYRLRSQ